MNKIMQYITTGLCCLCFFGVAFSATIQEPEIIIEMTGTDDAQPAPTLWDYTARQLTRKLKGKTREQLLYQSPVVSDKDRTINGSGTEYALVEYYDGGKFRKFLFRSETPQTFVAAAATAADVLAINKKYGINIGLTEEAFTRFYNTKAQRQAEDILHKDTALYQLSYTDVNTPIAQNHWFLFEKQNLRQTFFTAAEKDAYLQTLHLEQVEQQLQKTPARPASAQRPTVVRKALISGGTQWDQDNLPHVINYQPAMVLPQLQQQGPNYSGQPKRPNPVNPVPQKENSR